MTTESVSTLVPSTNAGRYALDDPVSGPDVTSGQPLAVLLGGHWIEGRVEHAGNLYASEREPRKPSGATTSLPPMAPFVACARACGYADVERKYTLMRSSKQAMFDQQRAQEKTMHGPLEREVLDILRDLAESGPHLSRLLALVEPTKTIYGVLGLTTAPTRKLTRKLAGGGLASHETSTRGKAQPTGFSLHSSREIPGWQAFEQGGRSPHATTALSD